MLNIRRYTYGHPHAPIGACVILLLVIIDNVLGLLSRLENVSSILYTCHVSKMERKYIYIYIYIINSLALNYLQIFQMKLVTD